MQIASDSRFWLSVPLATALGSLVTAAAIEAIDGPRSAWVLLFGLIFFIAGIASFTAVIMTMYDLVRHPAQLNLGNILFLVVSGFS